MKIALTAGLGALAFATAALAAAPTVPDISSLNPEALKALIPENIPWKAAAGLRGTETAVLYGDPGKPGFYVVLNRFHPGNFSHPHYHPNDRFIMVLSGTWWAATGVKDDPEHLTVPLKAGTFVVHKARHVHYDGARAGSGDAVVMIFGQGPGTRTDCTGPNAEQGPGPCADSRASGR
jgi:quercetin dioxygenase-like cupin family protein